MKQRVLRPKMSHAITKMSLMTDKTSMSRPISLAKTYFLSQISYFHKNMRGGAPMEFCMILPLFMFLLILIAQTMLLYLGKLHVEYAAFAAARAAIVQIPRHDMGPSYNEITPEDVKSEAIREAAYIALAGTASWNDDYATGSADIDIEDGLSELFSSYGAETPFWIEQLQNRLNYAEANTTIKIKRTEFGDDSPGELVELTGTHTFNPKDPVTIEVTHQKYLSMPYVRWIFADGENERQRTMKAQCTMHLEGVIMLPPDETPLPRANPG